MYKSEPLIEFNPKLLKLTQNQKKVLILLVEAGKLVVPLYKLQENHKLPGANFYPSDATKEEIKEAAEKDVQILSPYTIVERKEGKLVAIPYHKKYATFLKPIASKLLEAADETDNDNFKQSLKIQARALTEGIYEEAFIKWMKMGPFKLNISVGPNDYFDDELFSVKTSYQAWVGVLDQAETKEFAAYKHLILSTRRRSLILSSRIDSDEKNVRVKVMDTVLFSGLMARTAFVGLNHPTNLDFVKRSGSEIVLFKQANDLRMKEQILPIFNGFFSKEFKESFKQEDLREGSLNYIALHELAHNYLHYKDAAKRLQDLLPSIEELAATVLGIRVAGSLLLKDLVTTKGLESMIVAYLCRSMFLVEQLRKNKTMFNYTVGGTIFINFMLESGALKQYKGLAMPNFTKIFVSIHDLSLILERLLSFGIRKDAEFFIKRYGQVEKISYSH